MDTFISKEDKKLFGGYDFEPVYDQLNAFERRLFYLEQIKYIEDPKNFYKYSAYNKKVDGKYTHYYILSKIRSSDYTKGSGYLTHGFDAYKGRFHAQIIRALINFCNLDKDSLILDCCVGCGTLPIEANLLGYNAIAIDINPIACLDSIVKTKLLHTPSSTLLDKNSQFFDFSFYESLHISTENFNELIKEDIKTLYFIFLYLVIVSKSNILYTLRKRAFQKEFISQINVLKSFEIFKKKANLSLGSSKIIWGNSLTIMKLFRQNSVDLIITSPPYANLIDYLNKSAPQISYFFGPSEIDDLKFQSIGHNKVNNFQGTMKIYWANIYTLIHNCYKVLKYQKFLIIIIGNFSNMLKKYKLILNQIGFIIIFIIEKPSYNKIERKRTLEYILICSKA